MSGPRPGTLFVISAPSGTGKSTVAARLLAALPDLEFSVSFTTRGPRAGEVDGREYRFITREIFDTRVAGGDFLEWALVFGECYGTGLGETRDALGRGRDLLLDIDVQGAEQVRGGPIPSVSMMILPPDYTTLERRLRARGSEDDNTRRRRLAEARREVGQAGAFDYVVINDDLDETVEQLASIVRAERRRSERCGEDIRRVLATFPD